MPDSSSTHLSRRNILLGGAVAAIAPGGAVAEAAEDSPAAAARVSSRLVASRDLQADVVIVGGGMAGVCAAIAAARAGSEVILVQDRPVLGGNASSEVRMHIVGADHSGSRPREDARESGIIEEIRLESAVRNLQRSASMFDVIVYEWVKREPRITLLLNTHCTGVEMVSGDRIGAVLASRHGTEEAFRIRGSVFIDSSGDGRLGAEAGAEFRMGREGRAEFGESLAPENPDKMLLGSTLLFITREHDQPMPFVPPPWIHRFPKCEDLPHRSHNEWAYGYWWVEWGGELDTIRDNERIRDELLSAALGVWDHIKNSGRHPESEKWALEWLGFLPGKRESRRFIGDHVLTQQEVQRGEVFEDGVAFGGWPIDLHPPAGIYSPDKPADATRVPLYNIPLRCLYSRNISNLLFAGRNISASHVAFGSTRVMATCSVVGQAAGSAAALCARMKVTPRTLAREHIRALQQDLLRNDAYIIGATNSDPADVARSGAVRASSELAAGPAAGVIDGVHRGVGTVRHRWASDPQGKLPQWLEIRFRSRRRVREVHLVFDTGLNRPLTLTHSPAFNRKMLPGAQPESVRDYELQILQGESSRTVADVSGNWQRKRVHVFDAADADGIRLVVKATNGDASAKVFEIRAYA